MSRPYYQRAGWRWLPGMLAVAAGEARCWDQFPSGRVRVAGPQEEGGPCGAPLGWTPDLDDSATQGAALAVLRDVMGDPAVHALARHSRKDIVARSPSPAVVWGIVGLPTRDPITGQDMILHPHGTGPTLATALLAALDRLIPE